jgi:hypothetical protein
MKFMNVKEQWFLYDTIAVSPWVNTMAHPIPGWYPLFSDIAAADDLTFFNTRNKSIGLAYNNQESRDQIPYALVCESLSVGFFAPALSSQLGTLTTGTYRGRIDGISAFWENELPQHTSVTFRTNQDERLKTNCALVPACYGPVGYATGQGDTSTVGGNSGSVNAGGMGRADLKYRWVFPSGIDIPRRATIGVQLRFVEWARSVLASIWGPGNNEFYDSVAAEPIPTTELVYKPTMFMIQVLITGRRQVQQRGEYHA